MWETVRDALAAVCLIGGASLALIAAIGIVRFDSLFSRMHAATKPQVLGLLLILVGIGLRVDDWHALGLLVLVGVFQLMTAPIAGHMLGRAAYRAGISGHEGRVVDEPMPADPEPGPDAVRPDGVGGS